MKIVVKVFYQSNRKFMQRGKCLSEKKIVTKSNQYHNFVPHTCSPFNRLDFGIICFHFWHNMQINVTSRLPAI